MVGKCGEKWLLLQNVGDAPVLATCPIHRSHAKGREFKSQFGQDAYVAHLLKCESRPCAGVYMDIGCNDGIDGSNTYYFHNRSWYGKCFEADPRTFNRILRHSKRRDGVNKAVSDTIKVLPFLRVFDGNNGLSGLLRSMSTRAGSIHQRFRSRAIRVETITPLAVLQEYYAQNKTIDFVSLDVEGGEIPVIKAWPFDEKCVRVFSIEDNNWCNERSSFTEMKTLLSKRGTALSMSSE